MAFGDRLTPAENSAGVFLWSHIIHSHIRDRTFNRGSQAIVEQEPETLEVDTDNIIPRMVFRQLC